YRGEIVYPTGPKRWTCPITRGGIIQTPYKHRVLIETPTIPEEVQSPRSVLEVEKKDEDSKEEPEEEEDLEEEPEEEEEPE
ncbi:hypothetical protein Tco_0632098, partial [Tanacetum coccineum]